MPAEEPNPPRRSFLQELQHDIIAARACASEDPGESKLRKLKGKVGHVGIERVSTYDAFDALEVPMRRRPSETVRLSKIMRQLGWTNIRARGLSPGSYRERVRGFAREVPNHPVTVRLPNAF